MRCKNVRYQNISFLSQTTRAREHFMSIMRSRLPRETLSGVQCFYLCSSTDVCYLTQNDAYPADIALILIDYGSFHAHAFISEALASGTADAVIALDCGTARRLSACGIRVLAPSVYYFEVLSMQDFDIFADFLRHFIFAESTGYVLVQAYVNALGDAEMHAVIARLTVGISARASLLMQDRPVSEQMNECLAQFCELRTLVALYSRGECGYEYVSATSAGLHTHGKTTPSCMLKMLEIYFDQRFAALQQKMERIARNQQLMAEMRREALTQMARLAREDVQ